MTDLPVTTITPTNDTDSSQNGQSDIDTVDQSSQPVVQIDLKQKYKQTKQNYGSSSSAFRNGRPSWEPSFETTQPSAEYDEDAASEVAPTYETLKPMETVPSVESSPNSEDSKVNTVVSIKDNDVQKNSSQELPPKKKTKEKGLMATASATTQQASKKEQEFIASIKGAHGN